MYKIGDVVRVPSWFAAKLLGDGELTFSEAAKVRFGARIVAVSKSRSWYKLDNIVNWFPKDCLIGVETSSEVREISDEEFESILFGGVAV